MDLSTTGDLRGQPLGALQRARELRRLYLHSDSARGRDGKGGANHLVVSRDQLEEALGSAYQFEVITDCNSIGFLTGGHAAKEYRPQFLPQPFDFLLTGAGVRANYLEPPIPCFRAK